MTNRIMMGGPQTKATAFWVMMSAFGKRVVTTPTFPIQAGSPTSTDIMNLISGVFSHSFKRS